jgi:hypothetical protein
MLLPLPLCELLLLYITVVLGSTFCNCPLEPQAMLVIFFMICLTAD